MFQGFVTYLGGAGRLHQPGLVGVVARHVPALVAGAQLAEVLLGDGLLGVGAAVGARRHAPGVAVVLGPGGGGGGSFEGSNR